MLPLALLAAAAALTSPAAPPASPVEPAVDLAPARAHPGDAFLITVHGLGPQELPAAEVAGHRLSFFPIAGGFRAVAALPVEAEPGPLAITIARAEGPPLRAELAVEPIEFRHKNLRVSERFVRPPPPRVRRRIEADQRAFATAFAQEPSPPLFGGAFDWPRQDEVTGRFGDQRILNGRKGTRHYGLDLGGGIGAPVSAANAGRVVLVRKCWASGLSVVLWHGAGLFTTYFHLSKALVKPGAEVARGQRIGLVGKSGRVTGPHLHWGTKVNELYVDPESLLRLPFEDAEARAGAVGRP